MRHSPMTPPHAFHDDQPSGGGPLSSMKVLDLSGEHGAYVARLLSDLGADVLRIDRPGGEGHAPAAGPEDAHTALENFLHAGKRRITLDLASAHGRTQLVQLLTTHDVLIESAPPGQFEQWGIAYPDLARLQPRLIWTSITGFGRSGPYAGYRSSDAVAAAMGGQMSVCGSAGGEPLAFHPRQADFAASLQAAACILLAAARRHRTGLGAFCDISLQESAASSLDHVLVRYFADGTVAGRTGGRHWNDLFCIVPSADGWMQITPFLMWDTMVALMDQDGLAGELMSERWRDAAYQRAHAEEAIAAISRWTQARTSDDLFDLGQALRLPWAPVVPTQQLPESAQLQARDFFRNTAYPYRFSRFKPPARSQPIRPAQEPSDGLLRELASPPPSHSPSIRRSEPPGRSALARTTALEGLRILDFTRVLAGPYATRMLADFGAEVIKVQSHLTATGAESPDDPYFAAWNRNKRSITLDLSQPEARDLVRRLVPLCDGVVENFSRRVMSHWQLDYEHLVRLNPGLVMLSLSGMGHTGPWKDGVAYGPTVEALAGITHTASRGQPAPIGLGFAYADSIAGLYGVTAMLAALEWRRSSGLGQHIDLSEYEAMASLLGPDLDAGRHIAPSLLQLCLPCQGQDRWCVLVLDGDEDWAILRRLSPLADEGEDPRFSDSAGRLRHRRELQQALSPWSRAHTAQALMARLQAAGLAAGAVQDAADLAADPQLAARGFFVDVSHPARGRFRSDRSPACISDMPVREHHVPAMGEDNRHVFQTLLGMSDSAFDRLQSSRVIW